jgi:hypothetical protein
VLRSARTHQAIKKHRGKLLEPLDWYRLDQEAGMYTLLREQILCRFGKINIQTQDKLRELSYDQKITLGRALFSFESDADLTYWLESQF